MDDGRFNRVTRSLSLRVLITCMAFLVLPLVLYILIFTRQDYEERVVQLRETLHFVVRERARGIQTQIDAEWASLEQATPSQMAGIPQGGSLLYEEGARLLILDPNGEVLYAVVGQKGVANPLSVLLMPQGEIAFSVGRQEVPLSASTTVYGLTLTASLPEGPYAALHQRKALSELAAFLLFLALFGGGLVVALTRRFARPLRALSHTMSRVMGGAVEARYLPDVWGFEVNHLGLQCNAMLDVLTRTQSEAQTQRVGREKLAEELRIGQEIQKSLLPPLPPIQGLDLGAGFVPAQEVSGDLYDLFPLPDGRLLIVIGDAAGKGISACLFSLTLRSALRSTALHTEDLGPLVEKVNRLLLLDTVSSSFFITAWIALYNPHTRALTYASQGHPHALLRKANGVVSELSTGGMALGIQDLKVETATTTLQSGDLVLLYTDGLVEAHGYGMTRIKVQLPRVALLQAQQSADLYVEEVRKFAGDRPLHDDVAILVLKVR